MSSYFERYNQFGEPNLSLFDYTPARPFNQEAFQRLLNAVAIAGAEHGEYIRKRRARELQEAATNDPE